MTRVPITSPLAVLTTRTTQEHIMTTHSPTDLKPGDFVRHPDRKCHGLVHRRFARNDVGVVYADKYRDGITSYTYDLTGWERVETCTADERSILDDFREVASGEAQEAVYPEEGVVIAPHDAFKQRPELVKPGHVQVRVDDLDPQTVSGWSQWSVYCTDDEALVRVGRAMIASQVEHGDPSQHWPAESTPPADEKPTSATVTLYCPDCGEPITNTAMVEVNREGERYLDFCNVNVHTCPPAQPDEPTEFGARVTVTLPDGTREKWCRLGKHHPAPWLGETYDVPGEAWSLLCGRGTVTIGWDE